MKVLILVLSCLDHPYGKMIETSQKTWDSVQVEGVETVYYCGQSKKENTDKIIYLPIHDNFHAMGHKTIMAYEWALQNREFDYIARVNASCYVEKKNLVKYIEDKPKEGVFCGLIADSMYNVKYLWGGGQFIISRDIVQKVVENKDKWNHEMTEDVAVSDLLTRVGVEMDGSGCLCSVHKFKNKYTCYTYNRGVGGGYEFIGIEGIKQIEDQFFYRVKNDGDRSVDELIMNELFSVL